MEDYVGFHSEYFVDINWVTQERDSNICRENIMRKGYSRFASYTTYTHTDFYFICGGNFICITDLHNHKVLKLQGKILDTENDFIAVNSSGIYIYNTREIYLFDFNGKLINKHKFGQTNYVECIYFYGEYAYYSETKTANIETNVWKVCMSTGEKIKVWGSCKSDTYLDNVLKSAYRNKYKKDMRLFKTPSNIGSVNCAFLYVDGKEVYVGYTRSKYPNTLAYILKIDIKSLTAKVLDIIIPDDERQDVYYCALNLSRHSGLVMGGSSCFGTCSLDYMCSTDVLSVTSQPTAVNIRLKQSNEVGYLKNGIEYYWWDSMHLYKYEQNTASGMQDNAKDIVYDSYQTTLYHFLKESIVVRGGFYGSVSFYSLLNDKCNSYLCSISEQEINKLIEAYKDDTETIKSVDKKSKLEQSQVRNAVSENIHNSVINKVLSSDLTQQKTKLYCANCGQELPETARFCFSCGNSISNIDIADMFQQSEADLTLAEFRQNAPSMTGYREELLAYRKSLPDSWDYNAYVGILLGVGGSKHGDAACMNFAIGQGDNGNNVKKTLEAKGLMPLFEKYKGKKIDSATLLSDVENEILSIAPEYALIRQKLNGVLNGKSDSISTSVQVSTESAKTVQTVSKVNPVMAEPKKVKPAPVVTTPYDKYKKMPCHEVAYCFISRVAIWEGGAVKLDRNSSWFSESGLVSEYGEYLYYFKNMRDSVELYKISLRGNSSASAILTVKRDLGYHSDEEWYGCGYDCDTFYLGSEVLFSVQNNKIYVSLPQLIGVEFKDTSKVIKNNEIWSIDISNPQNINKEFEVKDELCAIYSPYVIGDKVLVKAANATGELWLLDKYGNRKVISRNDARSGYLSINEDGCIAHSHTNTAAYDFQAESKNSIQKVYKRSKYESLLFLDAKRDIFYYLEEKNDIFGEIIGINKSGEIVDVWNLISDEEFLKKAKHGNEECRLSFDGNLRVYKILATIKDDKGNDYFEECIYAVDRAGNCDERFTHRCVERNELCNTSALFIQTPNAVIVHLEHTEGVKYRQFREYMITTTGERNCKPLFD